MKVTYYQQASGVHRAVITEGFEVRAHLGPYKHSSDAERGVEAWVRNHQGVNPFKPTPEDLAKQQNNMAQGELFT